MRSETAPPAIDDVRRLDPRAWIVGAFREFAALIAVAVTALAIGGFGTGVYFALVALGFGVVHQAVRWLTFTYTVRTDRIELRRALVGRSVKTIPIERIRGVDITAGLAHRLLGLAVVRIDAAAGGDEGVLDAVSRREAMRLRTLLLPSGADPEDHVLARAESAWLRYAPLSGAYLLTPFALAGSALGTLYNLGDEFGLISTGTMTHLGDRVVGLPRGLVLAVFAVLVLAMPLASVVVFALFNWDFTLRADGPGSVVAERGLLTRRTVTLERRRIRGVELRDNPLERVAGVVRLTALVTGLGDAEHRGTLFPTAPRSAALAVAAEVTGPRPGPLVPHPPAARTRRLTRAVGPPLALAAVALFTGPSWLAVAALLASVAAVPLGLDRHRQLGHATDGFRLTFRSGSLTRRQQIIEHPAVVGWKLRQSLFQRRAGLATLTVAVGAGGGAYDALDLAAEDALRLAGTVTPGWVTPFLADRRPEA
ncbi:PH domain-containing protein [Actinocorallia longicatena]|uniref:PH domain-containing protein n=1 Tax=Actinocorallia longicatena TaxID=111803 RepID=A0ABP6QHQ8_9ACTN